MKNAREAKASTQQYTNTRGAKRNARGANEMHMEQKLQQKEMHVEQRLQHGNIQMHVEQKLQHSNNQLCA